MTPQEGNATAEAREFQLGVLLVHGIGTQRPGDTLVRWGDVLLKTLRRATGGKLEVHVERAGPGDGAAKGRFEAAVRLHRSERWLISEGWWADAFPAPTYRELVSWSVRAVPWSITTHIAERYWQVSSAGWNRARVLALVWSVASLLIALALAPLLLALLGLTLVLGLLPIAQIRAFVLKVQSTLTATVGDSLAFVESPIRAALMRTCILDGLERLKERCQHTVIVAHSQGAAAVLDALGGFIEPDKKHEAEPASHLVPDALVTFGAGTNQLASQKVLSAGLPKTFQSNPVFALVAALLGAVGMVLWMYLSVRFEETTNTKILWSVLLWLVVWIISAVVLSTARSLYRRRSLGPRVHALASGAIVAYLLVGSASLIVVSSKFDLPILSVIWLFFALGFIAGSVLLILSDEMREIVTARVRSPPGLANWIDLYASADPVPNGPTRTGGSGHRSIRIWNLGSVLGDHTAYWDNRDEFVLRVVRVCAETARSPWAFLLPPDSDLVDDRSRWRVTFLQAARWTAGSTWIVLGAFLLARHQASVTIPFDRPTWLPTELVRPALLVAGITSAMWATSGLLRWLWSWWIRKEQEAVLAREQPEGRANYRLVCVGMGMIVWTLIIATYVLMKSEWEDLWPIPTNPLELLRSAVTFLVMTVGPAFLSMVVLLKLKPPPIPPGPSGFASPE
jgi:hypothetical protein